MCYVHGNSFGGDVFPSQALISQWLNCIEIDSSKKSLLVVISCYATNIAVLINLISGITLNYMVERKTSRLLNRVYTLFPTSCFPFTPQSTTFEFRSKCFFNWPVGYSTSVLPFFPGHQMLLMPLVVFLSITSFCEEAA